DYPSLMEVYEKASILARTAHVPVLIHVKEVTQPQGHSTSGSHERYKSVSRLQWEKENDCNLKMRSWILDNGFASAEELVSLEKRIKKEVREAKKEAWNRFIALHIEEKNKVVAFLDALANVSVNKVFINKIKNDLIAIEEPIKKDMLSKARKVLRYVREEQSSEKQALINWISDFAAAMQPKYSSHLYSETSNKATEVNEVTPTYDIDAPIVDGRIVLRDNFDQLLGNHSKLLIFGEDSGTIGDVNQGLEGMQEKYGSHRVADTGIREATIIGQGIGMAMRGLRPIAEIQYLDYLLYGLQILSDDLATLHYRTAGYQKAPLIVRTRGHRLEGIWHAGSPM
ncbi:MAG: thiamine pyrophosphate-dependent enzyme, partial [Flavobacteriaceae bacterium]|nr:thiamine pyrophosphate-dependent enzyme [Flavobacteriaceae bacterium]